MWKYFVLWIGTLLTIPSFASIEPLFSVLELDGSQFEKEHALVVFDIDDTLTILEDPAFQRPNFKSFHADLFHQMMEPLSSKERIVSFTLPLLTTSGILIEPKSPAWIQTLQKNGIHVIGLTAAMGGTIGGVSVDKRRVDELHRVGIDFSNDLLPSETAILPNFQTPIFGNPPCYTRGILFTNEVDKGKVLVEFLKGISWKPKYIVFIDDRLEHLQAVEQALVQYDSTLQFQGFHFQTNPKCYQSLTMEEFEEKWAETIEMAIPKAI